MEATLFSSFGLLLMLMLHKPKKMYKITRQFDLLVFPQINYNRAGNDNDEREAITPQKKKKGKKNKKLNKANTQQSMNLYPRTSHNQQLMEIEWRKKQKQKEIKCSHIGKQVEAILAYFCEQLQTKIPYNGQNGLYVLTILIPGSTYSDVPIEIEFTQSYPYQLPAIAIQTHNLHPLEKQKLFQIVNQQQTLFFQTRQQFLEDSNKQSRIIEEASLRFQEKNQNYLQSYYKYAFNLCVAISQQLFYSPDNVVQQQQNLIAAKNRINKVDEQILPNSNAALLQKIETNKEIYQNILEEIFTRYDQDKQNVVNQQKPLPFEENNVIKHPNLRGRYLLDYQQLNMIGQGGFGSVYQCRNRVDSNIYAVKKMVINYNDPQSRKLLKEVALLSKLNHPNIVRYHQSWLQDTSSVEQLIADMSITDPQEIQQFNKIWKKYSIDHPSASGNDEDSRSNEDSGYDEQDEESSHGQSFQVRSEQESVIFGDDIIFDREYSSYVDFNQPKEKEKTKKNFMNMFQNQSQITETNRQRKKSKSRKHSQIYQFPFKILYIVMEYCGSMTLKDFISNRFHEKKDVKVKLIRGILEGLSYIHSRRIIHRDLKPANIFLIDNTNKVKIGDFGVATIGNIENNPYQAEITQYSEKTKGVGTSFYRAPQQFSSGLYDEKIDIYSLGIIMLQMFYPFETMMERRQILVQVTKTYKLPKQFNKFQHNSQFQQQIQSCISAKPGDRPTVQKLLQTFRNKYFTQLVSLIANPKHFEFYQLMNHLFQIKNETSFLMKQNLFKNYLTYAFTKIFQIHRGVLFTPISLVPVADFDTINGIKVPSNRKEKFLLLSQRGVVMQYPSNTYISWIRYARQTIKRNYKSEPHNHYKQDIIQTKEMRRFTFEKVAEFIGGDLKSQFSFKQKYVTAFDIVYPLQNEIKPFFLCQMLKISLLMIDTMSLTQRAPPIYLCHSLIFKCLAIKFNIPLLHLHKFLVSVSDEKFRSMKYQLKIEHMRSFGIQANIGKKIIILMDMEFQNDLSFMNYCKYGSTGNQIQVFKQELETVQLTSLYQQIQNQIKIIVQSMEIFNLNERVKWKLQIPSVNTHGFFWNVGPVKGFVSIQQYFNGQNLCNLHIQTSLNPSSEQNEADVSIWSNGQFLEKDIMQTVANCWKNNITAKWYDQSLGEKDLSCRYNIILKKKYDRVYLMLRKNHFGFDRNLQKKNSEGIDKQKQQKETSFILKEHFNFEVLKNEIKENNKKIAISH